MLPSHLQAKNFSAYPPHAKALAVQSLPLLQRVPLAVLPLFLRQLINYDWLFPPEQREFRRQLEYLGALPSAQFDALMQPFAAIRLPHEISDSDWVNQPRQFSGQLSAYLWSVHQIDGYHQAAQAYLEQLDAALPKQLPETPRFTMVVIGDDVKQTDLAVFRRLRPQGTLFTGVDAVSAWPALVSTLKARAQKFPSDHAHWYIDGGELSPGLATQPGIDFVSYSRIAPAVRKELALLNRYVNHPPASGTTNTEAATNYMADLTPQDLGFSDVAGDQVLQRFTRDILTEGSGTQVYSTTFVQWTARESLHRAQPLTLLARFTPRQQAGTMNQLLARDPFAQPTDAEGSLVDADMGAYLTWINQNRLPGADRAQFLAWFEGHSIAMAIGPAMAKGTTSDNPVNLAKVIDWMT
jgi:hypothetical protein